MASLPQHCCADYLTEDDPTDTQEPTPSAKSTQLGEREYDFVEKPSQDHLCPVTTASVHCSWWSANLQSLAARRKFFGRT